MIGIRPEILWQNPSLDPPRGQLWGHRATVQALARKTKEHDFKSWMGPGPNSDQIREIGPERAPEMRQNIGNPYQTEDNKNPRGRREVPPPWGAAGGGACCFSNILSLIFVGPWPMANVHKDVLLLLVARL